MDCPYFDPDALLLVIGPNAQSRASLRGSVSKQDILRVARTYLRPDGYVLVVVADQAKAALPE